MRARIAAVLGAAALLAGCASRTSPAGGGTDAKTYVELPSACAVTVPASSLVNDPGRLDLVNGGGRCRGQPAPVPPSLTPTSVPEDVTEPPPPPWTGTKAEQRFAWAEREAVMDAAAVTLVRGVTPREALEIVTTDRITPIEPAAQAERVVQRRSDAELVVAGSIPGGWTVVVEENGFNATVPPTPQRLARHGTAVVIFQNVNAMTSFQYAVNGRMVREFDPLLFGPPWTGRPLPQERGIRFGDPEDLNPMAQSFLLAYRLTGVALTEHDLTTTEHRVGVAVKI